MALPWGFVSKITNSKRQISNKFQITISNDPKSLALHLAIG
jgi:hypothetical protein